MKKLISLALVLTTLLSVFVAISSADDNTDNTPMDSTTESAIPEGETTTGDPEGTTTGDSEETTTGNPEGTTTGDSEGTTAGDSEETTTGDSEGTTTGDSEETTTGDPEETTTGDPGETTTGDITTEEPVEPEEPAECAPAGDTTGDGKINLGDVALLLKHIAKWSDLNIDIEQADAVNDDKINLADVSAMLKHIAKWNTVRLGHKDSVDVVKAPTCKETGETALACKVCESCVTVTTSTVPCSYDVCVITEPTCAKEGLEKYTCTMCKGTYDKVIKATGKHDYEKTVVTAPTCGTAGEDKYTCSVCKHSYTKIVKATGKHHFLDGVCYDCGKNESGHKVYNIGETWVVDGQWEFTINSVKKHEFCNKYAPSNDPLFGGEEVFIVEYTYKNIGYHLDSTVGLYMGAACFNIHDGENDVAHSYPCTHEKIPHFILKGETWKAREAFVIHHEGPAIYIRVSEFRSDNLKMESADFVIKIS